MTLIIKPKRIKLELMSNEIEIIIEELERQPHNIYEFYQTEKIINKLKNSIKTGAEK